LILKISQVAMTDIDRVEQLQVDLENSRQRATKLESDLMQLRVKLEEAQLSAANHFRATSSCKRDNGNATSTSCQNCEKSSNVCTAASFALPTSLSMNNDLVCVA
jgi:hypothetical protein